jgi:hypothetical protein
MDGDSAVGRTFDSSISTDGNAVVRRTLDNTSTPDNISMEAAQSEDQLPKGWAAACFEAVKAAKEAAFARDLDASDRKRMVDAAESISNSLRVLAEVAAKMMPVCCLLLVCGPELTTYRMTATMWRGMRGTSDCGLLYFPVPGRPVRLHV